MQTELYPLITPSVRQDFQKFLNALTDEEKALLLVCDMPINQIGSASENISKIAKLRRLLLDIFKTRVLCRNKNMIVPQAVRLQTAQVVYTPVTTIMKTDEIGRNTNNSRMSNARNYLSDVDGLVLDKIVNLLKDEDISSLSLVSKELRANVIQTTRMDDLSARRYLTQYFTKIIAAVDAISAADIEINMHIVIFDHKPSIPRLIINFKLTNKRSLEVSISLKKSNSIRLDKDWNKVANIDKKDEVNDLINLLVGKIIEHKQIINYFSNQEHSDIFCFVKRDGKSDFATELEDKLRASITDYYVWFDIHRNNSSFQQNNFVKKVLGIFNNQRKTHVGGKLKKKSVKKKYETLTIKELQERCIKRKIKYSGLNKTEIIKALRKQ